MAETHVSHAKFGSHAAVAILLQILEPHPELHPRSMAGRYYIQAKMHPRRYNPTMQLLMHLSDLRVAGAAVEVTEDDAAMEAGASIPSAMLFPPAGSVEGIACYGLAEAVEDRRSRHRL